MWRSFELRIFNFSKNYLTCTTTICAWERTAFLEKSKVWVPYIWFLFYSAILRKGWMIFFLTFMRLFPATLSYWIVAYVFSVLARRRVVTWKTTLAPLPTKWLSAAVIWSSSIAHSHFFYFIFSLYYSNHNVVISKFMNLYTYIGLLSFFLYKILIGI